VKTMVLLHKKWYPVVYIILSISKCLCTAAKELTYLFWHSIIETTV